tara:strand:- start:54 stop:518 length:465 start_codon:yes stop_codon:yes gene_type:complete
MLSDFLNSEHIVFGLNAKNKKHLFQELSTKSENLNKLLDQKTLFEKIIQREKLGNTCISNGIAMPSALIDQIEKTFVLFTKLSKPIDYGSADNKPVDLVCLVVSPTSSKSRHLYILSNFSRLLKNKYIANQLRGCENSDSLFAVLLNFNLSSAA